MRFSRGLGDTLVRSASLAGPGMPVLLHDTREVYVWPTSLWASVSHLGSGISGTLSSDKDTEEPCDSCVCPGQIAPLPFLQSFTQRFAVLSPGSRIPVQLALARRVQLSTGWWGSQQQGHGGALLPLAASPLSRLTCPTSQRHQGRTCSVSLERVAARAGLCEQTLPHQLSSPGVQ